MNKYQKSIKKDGLQKDLKMKRTTLFNVISKRQGGEQICLLLTQEMLTQAENRSLNTYANHNLVGKTRIL